MEIGIHIVDSGIYNPDTGEKATIPSFIVMFAEPETAFVIPVKLLRVLTDAILESHDGDVGKAKSFIEECANDPIVPIEEVEYCLACSISPDKTIRKSGDGI